MSENNMKYRGLCSTCKNAPGCTFPRDSQKPVLNCEEFEVDTCPSVETTREEKSASSAPVDVEDEDSNKFIGLCSNCDNRRTCVFPKPEGGVWHCEEYR
jgi:hypothetical protein